jgi:hypothetical protein
MSTVSSSDMIRGDGLCIIMIAKAKESRPRLPDLTPVDYFKIG